jgi:DNA-binding LacI/PurR family transcriptional regulator
MGALHHIHRLYPVSEFLVAKKRVSIKDIAVAAEVSHPTVSRALRGQGRMTDQTRQRILEIAQDMGYNPSLVARGLVTQRTFCVGLVVTNIADPFHSEIVRGVEETALSHGYSLFLATTDVDPERELQIVRSFQGRQVDGIIVSSSRLGSRHADRLDALDIPIVLINSHAEGNNLHNVCHDDYGGGRVVLAHLIEQGYKRIAYLGNSQAGKAQTDRLRAWQAALSESDLAAELQVNSPNGRYQGGVAGTERLLERAATLWHAPPDAIFCYNDTLAIGALSVLRRHGLQIPQDVAITGFDGIDVSAFVNPPLTTLQQPRYEMGLQAMQILLDLLAVDPELRNRPSGTDSVSYTRVMEGRLVIRESTCRLLDQSSPNQSLALRPEWLP